MPADCLSFLTDDFRFPARPINRRGLEHVAYRIAAYPEFRELLMRQIDTAVELREWTHRAPDDPGIALLEGAAIVGDILTFYQEHYANEAFLRTASWRESIDRLTRLIGYRLAPGVGGNTTFAFEAKGNTPITIPQGFAVKAELEDADKADNFQTSEAVTAYPHLSAFNLHRKRYYINYIPANTTKLEVASAGGNASHAALADLDLQPGDKILLLPSEPSWTTSGSSLSGSQKTPQILEVKAVEEKLDRRIIEFDTAIEQSWTRPLSAYRLGRDFRHFGQAAPDKFTKNKVDSGGTVTGARQYNTGYFRHVRPNHSCANTSASQNLPGQVIPLDGQVDGLSVGGNIIVQVRVRNGSGGNLKPLTVLKTIGSMRVTTLGFAALTGPVTWLTMDSALLRHTGVYDAESDVRDYLVHEVTSPAIEFRPEALHVDWSFFNGNNVLYFYGRLKEAQTLAGRRLALKREDGENIELTCIKETSDFALTSSQVDDPRMWPLSFDKAPKPFTRADFDEETPTVTVYGNLADATQGKNEGEAVLGNGDARQGFQTFKVPKVPLTFLISAGATPPQVPELDVYVEGRKWSRVASLFGHASDEEIYVVREDADGASYIQFGDGLTGTRLPSGIKNVSAHYRSGTGAKGLIKSGKTPLAGERIEGLDKVQLPGRVAGGAEPEDGDNAREAAPGKIQSLGRLVSIRDYETELLTIPGVIRSAAGWGLEDGVPTLTVRVLLEAGREAEFAAVKETIATYQRCRGPDRFAIRVEQASLRYAYLSLLFAFDPILQEADVAAAIKTAMGLAGVKESDRSGLFGLRNRRLGEREYLTRIEGAVQQVAGVLWCKASGLGLFAAGATEPNDLSVPAAPLPRPTVVTPAENELLQLDARHLLLATAPPPPAEECA